MQESTYPRGENRVRRASFIVALLVAAGVPLAADAAPGDAGPLAPLLAAVTDRIVLVDSGDRGYALLDVPEAVRVHAGAKLRLVVLRAGEPVADRGLRDRRTVEPLGDERGARGYRERSLVENAYIAADGRSAVVVRNESETVQERGGDVRLVAGSSTLDWIDLEHPEGRWNLSLDGDRIIRLAYPLSGSRGVAVMASRAGEFGGDFGVYDPAGVRFVHFGGLEGTPRELRPTAHDAFLAVELAFASRPGFPDQGVVVVDLLRRAHWTYAWWYGTDREPTSWEIADTGVLTLRFAERTASYDRFGHELEDRGGRRRRE